MAPSDTLVTSDQREHALELGRLAVVEAEKGRGDVALTHLSHALVVALDHDADIRALMRDLVATGGGFA